MRQSPGFFLFGGAVLVAAALLITPEHVSAFGVSPPFVNMHILLPGSRYETTIFLVQGKPENDLRIRATFDVPERARSWFSTDQETQEFVIPKGVQQFPLKVRIQVPKNAELGVYNGYLRIVTVPLEQGDTVSIASGVRVDLNLTVGEGVVQDFTIRNLDILDTREGENPKITVTIENTGNVTAAADRATFDLSDKYDNVRLGFAQVEKLPEVPAFETKTFTVEFPINVKLAVGEYWGHAQIFRGRNVAFDLKTVFNVTERKIDYTLYGSIFAAALLLVGGVSLVLRKRRVGKG